MPYLHSQAASRKHRLNGSPIERAMNTKLSHKRQTPGAKPNPDPVPNVSECIASQRGRHPAQWRCGPALIGRPPAYVQQSSLVKPLPPSHTATNNRTPRSPGIGAQAANNSDIPGAEAKKINHNRHGLLPQKRPAAPCHEGKPPRIKWTNKPCQGAGPTDGG